MSVAMVSMVLDCFPAGGSLRCLAVAIADAADDDGGSIYKSIATLAHQSVQSERTVQRTLPKLVAGGWLEVMSDASGGRGRATVYRIAPSWVTRCAIERANARMEQRRPRHVELSTEPPEKGDRLTPFSETRKGDISAQKGDKNGLKGDTHGCHPNVNKERNTDPPLPPNGGREPVAVDNSGGVEATAGQPDADGFIASFWSLYPRRVDEQLSRKAWAQLAPSADLQREIAAAVRAWTASAEWQREGGRFVPKPHNWLRRKRWTDVPGLADAPPVVDEAARTRAALDARDAEPPADPAKARQLAEECRNRLGLRQRRAGQVAEGVAA